MNQIENTNDLNKRIIPFHDRGIIWPDQTVDGTNDVYLPSREKEEKGFMFH